MSVRETTILGTYTHAIPPPRKQRTHTSKQTYTCNAIYTQYFIYFPSKFSAHLARIRQHTQHTRTHICARTHWPPDTRTHTKMLVGSLVVRNRRQCRNYTRVDDDVDADDDDVTKGRHTPPLSHPNPMLWLVRWSQYTHIRRAQPSESVALGKHSPLLVGLHRSE